MNIRVTIIAFLMAALLVNCVHAVSNSPFTSAAAAAPPASSPTQQLVAVHVSENTELHWPYTSWLYFHTYQFLEEALRSDGTPFVEVSDFDIESGALLDGTSPRYPILISLATECVSDSEAQQIKNYVNAGGHVYVGSSAWTKYADGQARLQNGKQVFALSSEMGLTGGGWIMVNTLVRTGVASTMVDHLPYDPNSPRNWLWWLPLSYNFSAGESTLLLGGRHFMWGARPTNTAPASVILSPIREKGFNTSRSWLASGSIFGISSESDFADVNGDGKADMVGRVNGVIYVALSNGQRFLTPSVWCTWNPAFDLHFADANGDGKSDIMGRNSSNGNVQVGLSFGSGFASSTSWASWALNHDVHFADVNGDRRADIIGRNSGSGNIQVGISNGSVFAPSTSWAFWALNHDVHLADANGNGMADLVGRNSGNANVQVGLSNGSLFATSTSWASWALNHNVLLADASGDDKADIIGRNSGTADVQVGVSTGSEFTTSTSWGTWALTHNIQFADANGDGKADIMGRNSISGDVQVGLSTGNSTASPNQASGIAKLAQKTFGAGKFTYNAALMPLAGYGGHASDNSEYKTIRVAIDEAFKANSLPLVRLSPWPYPNKAGFVYRHDHWLSLDVVDEEFARGVKGEYFIQPDANPDSPDNDYYEGIPQALAKGAIVGSHINEHANPDLFSEADAFSRIAATKQQIFVETGVMPKVFTAPNYAAVRKSSMNAIWNNGYLTTGEQGIGPMPHFSIDPEIKGQYIGTLLQLPTSEWPGPYPDGTAETYDSMDNMTRDLSVIPKAVDLSYEAGGLINVYDHAGGAALFNINRKDLAIYLLNYVFSKPYVWKSHSQEIRNWWLQRSRKSIGSTFRFIDAGHAEILVSIQTADPLATTTFSEDEIGLRISLDATSLSLAQQGIVLLVNGVPRSATTLTGNDLFVKVGSGSSITILLGQ